ncbi:hypothetical protein MMC10_000425 [Thelotrema lepadinum]|nr:hypothetical protein [Thelotrema lepadinum]
MCQGDFHVFDPVKCHERKECNELRQTIRGSPFRPDLDRYPDLHRSPKWLAKAKEADLAGEGNKPYLNLPKPPEGLSEGYQPLPNYATRLPPNGFPGEPEAARNTRNPYNARPQLPEWLETELAPAREDSAFRKKGDELTESFAKLDFDKDSNPDEKRFTMPRRNALAGEYLERQKILTEKMAKDAELDRARHQKFMEEMDKIAKDGELDRAKHQWEMFKIRERIDT